MQGEIDPAAVRHKVTRKCGARRLLQSARGVVQQHAISQLPPLLSESNPRRIEPQPARREVCHPGPHEQRQRIPMHGLHTQRVERSPAHLQQIVHDVVAPGRQVQPEGRKRSPQPLHVEVLGAQLPQQRVGSDSEGRRERIERPGRREGEREITRAKRGPRRQAVRGEARSGRADAVRAAVAADFDAVQPDPGRKAPPGGRGLGIERQRAAERLGHHPEGRQIDLRHAAREGKALRLRRQFSLYLQRKPQRLVVVEQAPREAVLRQIGFEFEPAQIASLPDHAADLRPQGCRGPRRKRIEPLAAGREKQVEHAERVGREEGPEREAVAAQQGVVTLRPAVVASVEKQPPLPGRQRRRAIVSRTVSPDPALQPDPAGDCHAAAQRRVGQQRQQRIQVVEITPEAEVGRQTPGIGQVTHRTVRLYRSQPGRRDAQRQPPDVAQRTVRGQVHTHVAPLEHGKRQPGTQQQRIPGRDTGREVGGDSRRRVRLQRPRPGRQIGLQRGVCRAQVEVRECDAGRIHAEAAVQLLHVHAAPLGKAHPPDQQGDLRAPVADRVDFQVKPRQGNALRVEARRGSVAQRSVFDAVVRQHDTSDQHAPRLRRRRGGFRFCAALRRIVPRAPGRRMRRDRLRGVGRRGSCPVGIFAPFEQQAADRHVAVAQPDHAPLDHTARQAHRQFRNRRRRPHAEGGVGHDKLPDRDRPGRRRRAVRPFRGISGPQVERDVGTGERHRPEVDPLRPKPDTALLEREPPRRKAQLHPAERISIAGREVAQLEAVDNHLLPQQGPQRGIEREAPAAQQRIRPVVQKGSLNGQAQRERQPQPFDRQLHVERPRSIRRSLAPDKVLNGRHIEQSRQQQHREQKPRQRAQRMFHDFFQHPSSGSLQPPPESSNFVQDTKSARLPGTRRRNKFTRPDIPVPDSHPASGTAAVRKQKPRHLAVPGFLRDRL